MRDEQRTKRPGAELDVKPPAEPASGPTPGRRTLSPVSHGVRGPGGSLPYLDTIQKSFGAHDVSSVTAHRDAAAREAASALGAQAYATGERVAFGGEPDLHAAAEEAAHVVQQRSGISLPDKIGQSDDEYEAHALAVADLVAAGESAEPLLDVMTGREAGKNTAPSSEADAPQAQLRPDPGQRRPPKKDPWEYLFKGPSHAVKRAGRVQAERGVRLRKSPSPSGKTLDIVPFDTEVMVQRESTERAENDRWAYVVTRGGVAGFCERQYVTTDMPECSAHLYLIKKGDTLGGIAEKKYGRQIESGNDARLYVHALYLANKHRTGIVLEDVDLSRMETALRGKDEEETLRVYKGVRVLEGMAIWTPSNDFIQTLKEKGAITSGQTSLGKAWTEARETVEDAVDDVKYAGGLVAGLLEGAGEAVYDMFEGAARMAIGVADVVMKIITGDFGGIVGKAKDWIGDLARLWKDKDEVKEGFLAKWHDPDAWQRGRFRGEVIGWVLMTILICVLTAGTATAGVVAVLATKFPTLVSALQAVGKIGDAMTYAQQAARGAKRIGDAAEDVVEAKMRAARRREERRDDDGDDDRGPDRKPDRDKPERRDRDRDRDDDRGSSRSVELLRKIRSSTKIAKIKLAETGVSTEDFELAKASYDFVRAAQERANDEDLDAFILQERDSDSGADCRRVVVMPRAMPALAAQARRKGRDAEAIERFAEGDRDRVRVNGDINGKTFQVNLNVVYNGPH